MVDYDIISKFRRSKIRVKILNSLQEPRTVMDLAKQLNKHKASISRAFLDLTKDGLI